MQCNGMVASALGVRLQESKVGVRDVRHKNVVSRMSMYVVKRASIMHEKMQVSSLQHQKPKGPKLLSPSKSQQMFLLNFRSKNWTTVEAK
jgi:hypothetical protein